MRLRYWLLIIFAITHIKYMQTAGQPIAVTVALIYERLMSDKLEFLRTVGSPGTLNTIFNPTGTFLSIEGSVQSPKATPPGTVVTKIKEKVYPSINGFILSGATCVAIDNNGKIVVAGYSTLGNPGLTSQFTIARYNTNGSLDTTFNPNPHQAGVVITQILYEQQAQDAKIYGVAIDALNRIVVVGYAANGAGGNFLAIARYTSAGVLDTTFNPTGLQPLGQQNNKITRLPGVVLTRIGKAPTINARATAVRIVDSSILVAGYAFFPTATGCILLARYTESGTLDIRLNPTGLANTNTNVIIEPGIVSTFIPGPQYPYAQATAMTIDSNNRIVVAGRASKPALTNYQSLIVRYTELADGSVILDKNFDPFGLPGRGIAILSVGSVSEAYGVVTDTLDKIIIAGYTSITAVGQTYVSRYLSTGTIDKTFNAFGEQQGLHIIKVGGFSTASGLIIDGCGNIIVAGYSYYPVTSTYATNVFLIYRLNSDGTLSRVFTTTGTTLASSYTYSPTGGIVLTRIGNAAPVIIGLLPTDPRYRFGVTMVCFKNKIYVAGQSDVTIVTGNTNYTLPCFAVASYDNA
jgi:uncharacterized delta-60 repeat protein